MERRVQKQGLTGTAIKLIACICMLADHSVRSLSAGRAGILVGSDIIGRIAFPLFCMMLAEGFFHTRDIRRYCLRVGVLALVSEPFFDRALNGHWLTFRVQNTVCLLFFGLLLFALLQMLRKDDARPYRQSILLQALLVAAFALAAKLLHLDYGAQGILALAACFYGSSLATYPNQDTLFAKQKRAASLFFACLFLNLDGFSSPAAFLSLIPAWFYDGTRGQKSRALGTAFYLFYPLHLLILTLLVI